MIKRLKSVDNRWFFTELPPIFKMCLLYIRGDLIVLFPFTIALILSALVSLKFMIIVLGLYVTVRQGGEMIYWFSHQFGERKYRPYDFGFKNLDNHAIYIIYQTLAIVWVVMGMSIVIFQLYFT